MKQQKGFILISTLLISLCLMSILFALSRQVIQQKELLFLEEKKIILQYLAQAGLTHGSYLSEIPGWSTDIKQPAQNKLKTWLIRSFSEGGSIGHTEKFSKGGYKIIKTAGQPSLYSIGFIGDTLSKAKYRYILKEENSFWSIL